MAVKRMFSMNVVDTDRFLDLPTSAQALYFHLGLRADDDGFVASPRRVVQIASCAPDDFKLLVAKGFIIPFNSGVCVVTDWRMNNDLKNDRHHPTIYQQEYQMLSCDNRRYFLLDTSCTQAVSSLDTESSLAKSSIDKVSKGGCSSLASEDKQRPQPSPAPLLESVKEYAREQGASDEEAVKFFDYNAARGWLVSGKPVADWKALFRSWMSHATAATTSGKTEQELIEESRKYSL